ncbi:MAG: adenylate/guanylate cyclase domain-containing protein [Treponema sp.]|jgi:adenylate cyclase|nr:adenylate/guanylate cyclase domain-containing protein [Treponema sp.]
MADVGDRRKSRVFARFPLALKLSLAVSALLVFSLGAVIFSVWFLVRADVRNTAVADNDSINYRVAGAAETALEQIRSDTSLLLGGDMADQKPVEFFFAQNPQIAAVVSLGVEGAESAYTLINRGFIRSRGIDVSQIAAYLRLRGGRILEQGPEERLFNAAPDFSGLPIMVLVFPYTGREGLRSRALVFFLAEKLTDYFGFGANPSVMLNDRGDVLVHSDAEVLKTAANLGENPAVQLLRAGGGDHLQTHYREAPPFRPLPGRTVFASVRRLDFGGAMVLTSISGDVVYEGVNATTRRNGYFAISVWFIALLLIRFFSTRLTRQLRILKDAAEEIEDGRYHGSIPVKTRDETGLLARTMNSMSMALQSFERLTNKEIARLTRKGLLMPGGVEKKGVFLFSDIRSFTAISSQMASAKVVELLNGYMDLMVACVMATGGVIDKFIGDAIMAHWGAVRPEPSRTEQSAGDAETIAAAEKQDALAAVRTALMMRSALQCFNRSRGGGGNPVIKNGCGINSGTVVAGQIGTEDRLEYTVIGDAVRLADHTESFNKPFGTDILITEHAWELTREYLVTEEFPSITENNIKVRLFAVINLRDPEQIKRFFTEFEKLPNIDINTAKAFVGTDGPHTLRELRFRLDISEPDLRKVATNEKKFKVLGR